MQVFKTKAFARFARREGIPDAVLLKAVASAEVAPDADLGGGVIKQRVARSGRQVGWVSNGDRIPAGHLAFFVYGFAKNDQGNMSTAEERVLRKLARFLLTSTNDEQVALLKRGEIVRVEKDE